MLERKWWTLIAVCLATFMLLLDISIVNVALPSIQRDLGANFTDLQWVIDAYALTLAALLLTSGSVADLVGRRSVFLWGLVLFTGASLLCGLSDSPTFLNLARALQGIGGAFMFATSQALIAQEFSGPQRAVAFGIWGAITGAAVAIGPLVGGILTEGLGWEWIFFVNVPIGIATFAVTITQVKESRSPSGGRIDRLGTATFCAALVLLVFSLLRGNDEGWGSTLIVGSLLGAVALLAAFLLVERASPAPMFPLELFRKPAFTGVSAVAFALSASMFAMFLYLTLYMQNVLEFSPLQSGLRFLVITLPMLFMSLVAGKLFERVPARILFGVGLAFIGGGLLLMGGLSADSHWGTLIPGFVVAGAGIGMLLPSLASTAVGIVEPQRSGLAAGANSTFRQLGIATGIAGLGAIFQSRVETKATDLLSAIPGLPVPRVHQIADTIALGGGRGVAQSVPPPIRDSVTEAAHAAFVFGLNDILVIAAVVALAGAVLGFLLVRARDFIAPPVPAQAPPASEPASA